MSRKNKNPSSDRGFFYINTWVYWGIFVEYLNKDQDKAVDERQKDLRQKDLNKFMEAAIGRKPKEQSWINLI